ncbi:hypothetical protein KAU33_05680 [Candidatus Dependentiae bacterium]|nr:hypothetical protein [Candidatus Dependentiae bacterium]
MIKNKVCLVIVFLLIILTVNIYADSSDKKFEELFKTASLWEVGENKEVVQNARKKLEKTGEPAIKFIINNKLSTDKTLELRAINQVLISSPEITKPLLRKLLKENKASDLAIKNAIVLLGKLKDLESKDMILEFFKIKKFRLAVISYSKSLKILELEPLILQELNSIQEPEALTYLNILGTIGGIKSIEALLDYLESDKNILLRTTAELSIIKIIQPKHYDLIIRKFKKTKNKKLKYHLIQIMGETKDDQFEEILIKTLKHKDWNIRLITIINLRKLPKSKIIKTAFEKLSKKEKNPYVKSHLQ